MKVNARQIIYRIKHAALVQCFDMWANNVREQVNILGSIRICAECYSLQAKILQMTIEDMFALFLMEFHMRIFLLRGGALNPLETLTFACTLHFLGGSRRR